MTNTLTAEMTGFSVPTMLDGLIKGLRTLHARREQRLILGSLLGMDTRLLDDLGISSGDVREVLRRTQAAGPSLQDRRRANALAWTPKGARPA